MSANWLEIAREVLAEQQSGAATKATKATKAPLWSHRSLSSQARDRESAALVAAAIEGLALTADELRAHLAAEDLEDLAAGRIDARTLRAYAEAIVARRAREGGAVPDGWTKVVVCAGCGPVWLWPGLPARVDGCPWCWNRARGLPVPYP